MSDLTAPQRKALTILVEQGDVSPRQLAQLMWPDSPAWNKRTRGSGSANRAGAVGGTMPMNGARILWRLLDLGYAMNEERGLWRATEKGRAAIA